MSSLRPGQPHNPHYAIFALNLASNENFLMVLNVGSNAQARRRRRAATFTATPPSTTMLDTTHPSTVNDGYQSSDDSLHLPPSSAARQRRARANSHFLQPLLLPGHSVEPVVTSACSHDATVTAAPGSRRVCRRKRNSVSSVSSSSAFSWQESIFHVRRLSAGDDDGASRDGSSKQQQPITPRVIKSGRGDSRELVPPPRHGSRPHPNPLRSNPVFEGGWL